jgi:hypothetical protein
VQTRICAESKRIRKHFEHISTTLGGTQRRCSTWNTRSLCTETKNLRTIAGPHTEHPSWANSFRQMDSIEKPRAQLLTLNLPFGLTFNEDDLGRTSSPTAYLEFSFLTLAMFHVGRFIATRERGSCSPETAQDVRGPPLWNTHREFCPARNWNGHGTSQTLGGMFHVEHFPFPAEK